MHVKGCASHEDIGGPYLATFLELQSECGCRPDGPSSSSYEWTLSKGHPEILSLR